MVCRSICNLPSESERSDDKLNVEDEDEGEEDDDEEDDDDNSNDMSSTLLPSDRDLFKEQKQLQTDKVSIMVHRVLFSSEQIACECIFIQGLYSTSSMTCWLADYNNNQLLRIGCIHSVRE